MGYAWYYWSTLSYWNYRRKKGAEGDYCNEPTEAITPYLRAIDAINPLDPAFHNAIQAGITSVMVGPGSARYLYLTKN